MFSFEHLVVVFARKTDNTHTDRICQKIDKMNTGQTVEKNRVT